MPRKRKPEILSQAVVVITELASGQFIIRSDNDNRSPASQFADALCKLGFEVVRNELEGKGWKTAYHHKSRKAADAAAGEKGEAKT